MASARLRPTTAKLSSKWEPPGEAPMAAQMSDRLFQSGVFAQSIGFPTVPRGQARLRTIVTATHTREDLDYALEMFGKVGKELGVIS